MKLFILKFLFFITIISIALIGFCFLPTTPVAKKSLFMASLQKDSLLEKNDSNRLIFVGGSNLCFGLNSDEIKDSLNLNPINTSINAGIGLEYIIDHVKKYIKKGDIILLVPEYQHFYDNFAYGSDGDELLRTIVDKRPIFFDHLNGLQLFYIMKQIPKYAISKFDPSEYIIKPNIKYPIDCFNEYGDVTVHWGLTKQYFKTQKSVGDHFNFSMVDKIMAFNQFIQKNGAKLYLSFPGYQSASFSNSEEKIKKIEMILRGTNIPVLGNAHRYIMADSLLFDTPYHLNKKGVDLRTRLLIDDFKNGMK